MKVFKIKKSWLKDLPRMLKAVGATKGNQSFPDHVYIAKADVKKIKQELTKIGKKRGLRGGRLSLAVGLEFLNYGPNETLQDAIKPGYLLVDFERIKNESK